MKVHALVLDWMLQDADDRSQPLHPESIESRLAVELLCCASVSASSCTGRLVLEFGMICCRALGLNEST